VDHVHLVPLDATTSKWQRPSDSWQNTMRRTLMLSRVSRLPAVLAFPTYRMAPDFGCL